eukprot:scaffold7114_cov264-Pinguiococcus_pyrenoidosus.AAC.10
MKCLQRLTQRLYPPSHSGIIHGKARTSRGILAPQAEEMATSGAREAEFVHFPPFYTLQPVVGVRERQLRLWQDLVLKWHHEHNETFLSVNEWPLFQNPSIRRSLKAEDRQMVAQYLIRNGYAEWEVCH